MREFWTQYDHHTSVIRQQEIFELLDKGYTVRSIEFDKKEESGGAENVRG